MIVGLIVIYDHIITVAVRNLDTIVIVTLRAGGSVIIGLSHVG